MQTLDTTPAATRAIQAIAELLAKLRLDFMFVGEVARVAWLGGAIERGSVDVVAVMQPQQKNQIAMMASHRGFVVNPQEVEQSEELDLIPLKFEDVRVHVLVATNALYGTMVSAAKEVGGIKVATLEDLALLFALAEDFDVVRRLAASSDFNRQQYNQKLISIGLRELVV